MSLPSRALGVAAVFAAVALAGCTMPDPVMEPSGHDTIMAKARMLAIDLDTPQKAWDAGYRPDHYCIPGMGVHWIHMPGQPESHFDTTLDEDRPEVILFQPATANLTDFANLTFVGIEYVVVTEGTSMNTTETVPTLHGVPFYGPMAGHAPGMPWHAELHVYLLAGHESGEDFHQENPAVQCPEGTTPPQA